MKGLDREQAAAFAERFGNVSENSVRNWGKLEYNEVIPHLIAAFRYSMGQLDVDAVDRSNWFTRTILPHLVFTGWFLPPQNVKTINASGDELPAVSVDGDLAALEAAMEEFIAALEAGNLETRPHMIFGDIGPEGWAKFHVLHLRHHAKQFSV